MGSPGKVWHDRTLEVVGSTPIGSTKLYSVKELLFAAVFRPRQEEFFTVTRSLYFRVTVLLSILLFHKICRDFLFIADISSYMPACISRTY
jgi:hypothetical protein